MKKVMGRKNGYTVEYVAKSNFTNLTLKFLEQCIHSFKDEMELYSRQNQEKCIWQYYGERPLLGLLCAGLIRNHSTKSLSMIQEFAVKDKDELSGFEKGVGRCDLFINNNRSAYLFEAKKVSDSGSSSKRWDENMHSDYLKNFDTQIEKYIRNQKHNYGGFYSSVKLVTFVFNSIYQDNEKKFISYLERA